MRYYISLIFSLVGCLFLGFKFGTAVSVGVYFNVMAICWMLDKKEE